ncbi:MAG: DUF6531 domain-containing protein [Mariprofundaceae bacterium]|nr:DUF6531 domain-containing protein [Mariprofundaceae bacterium]
MRYWQYGLCSKSCDFILCLVLFFFVTMNAMSAWAEVDLKTGSYQKQYQDVVRLDSLNISLSRYYRSNSSYVGWFGLGWGSTFETQLTFMPDAIVLQESGHGKATWFQRGSDQGKMASQSVATIRSFMQDNQSKKSDKWYQSLREHASERLEQWQHAVGLGMAYDFVTTDSQKWETHGCACHDLKAMPWGYRHTVNGILTHDFDSQGRLFRLWHKDKSFLQLSYDLDAIRIEDKAGHGLQLSLNRQGRVDLISSQNSQESYYIYGDRAVLLYSRNAKKKGF